MCWKARYHSTSKDLYSQGYGLPSSYARAIKKAEYQRIDAYKLVLEKTPESPLDSREIKPANLKRKSTLNTHWRDWCWSWSSSILVTWYEPSQLIGKVPDVGKNWRQKKRVSEDKMAGWHHTCNKHELEQPLGDDEGHRLNVLQSMGLQSQTQLGDWTTTTGYFGRKQIIKWPSMAGIGFVIQKPTGSYLINRQTLYLGKMMSDTIWYSF